MGIYEKAMELELEGKQMYEEMLSKTTDAGLQGVLRTLADFEQNHYDVFSALAQSGGHIKVQELTLPSIKSIVAKLKDTAGEEELDAVLIQYKQALALEEENEKVYLDFAEQAKSDEEKNQFLAVAAEEKKHKGVIKSIIDYIEGPILPVESAEF